MCDQRTLRRHLAVRKISTSGLYLRFKFRLRLVQDFFLSLFYNCHLSKSYVFDILLEPGRCLQLN